MPLTMRPTGLASPIDKDRQDYTIFSGEWAMGRIYEKNGAPAATRWYWLLYGAFSKPDNLHPDGRAPTLNEAKAQLEAAWRQRLEWARLREDT
jgi:hypothetical protein